MGAENGEKSVGGVKCAVGRGNEVRAAGHTI